MIVAETRSFDLGPFTVHQRPRFDNPAFAVYMVFRGIRLVGKSFSVPNRDWCESIERIEKLGRYVLDSAPLKRHSYRLPKRR